MIPGDGNGGGGARTARDPETDKARLRAIHAALGAGDIAGAGKMAEDALGDGIDHVMVLSLVAGRREEEGRFEEALALLGGRRRRRPRRPASSTRSGSTSLWLGRPEEAAAEFGAALAADPGFAPALANRGTALVALARLNDGAARLRGGAGDRSRQSDRAQRPRRAGAAGAATRSRRASCATQVIARQPDFPEALMTLAGADIAEGRAARRRGAPAAAARRPQAGAGRPGDGPGPARRRARRRGPLRRGVRGLCGGQRAAPRPTMRAQGDTLRLVRELTAALAGRRVARDLGARRRRAGPAPRLPGRLPALGRDPARAGARRPSAT